MQTQTSKPMSDRDKIAHLLRRFGLGASEAEVNYYAGLGFDRAINQLINFENLEDLCDWDPMEFSNGKNVVNLRVMQGLWYARILCTQRPLEEKMTIFWHNHFATSSQKVENAFVMHNHIGTLRKHGTGKFYDLLLAVSQDPGMIFWLDNQLNVLGKPNENFAREVMELFTLGIGHYSEKDIQEAARAFTGWGYGITRPSGRAIINENSPRRPDKFTFYAERHDNGTKTVFGKSGNFNGEDVLRLLCDNPQTSRFIVRKMWEFFVSSNVNEAAVERVAAEFRNSDLDIKVALRGIMKSPEFYSAEIVRRYTKNPIDFSVATARQTGAGGVMVEKIKDAIANPVRSEQGVNTMLVRAIGPAFALLQSTTSMGMELMSPPDVSGWKQGDHWITSATILERVKWADRLFVGGGGGQAVNLGGNAGARRGGPSVAFDPWTIFGANPSPTGAVMALMSLFDVSLPDKKQAVLSEAAKNASGGNVTPGNSGAVARAVCRLMFGSPEFQFG